MLTAKRHNLILTSNVDPRTVTGRIKISIMTVDHRWNMGIQMNRKELTIRLYICYTFANCKLKKNILFNGLYKKNISVVRGLNKHISLQ